MKALGFQAISGPNIYHYRPIVILYVDLEEFTDISSLGIKGFNERLITLLPSLANHRCSPRRHGGFIERLQRGTYFAHIIEHVALELSELAGIGVNYGKSIYDGSPGKYKIIVRSKNNKAMEFLLKKSLEIVESAAFSRMFDIETCLNKARKIIKDSQLGPSTQAILDAAKLKNIPIRFVTDKNYIQLGYGKYRKFIDATTSSLTSDMAVEIAQDKYITKQILDDASVLVPQGRPVTTLDEALELQKQIAGPIAVKPVDGNHGRGVFINIKDQRELEIAFVEAKKHSQEVIVEKSLKGKDYRILVINGKMIAAAERIPAHVIGDGIHSIEELIEIENKNPRRGDGHDNVLTKISIDIETFNLLHRANKKLSSVLSQGEVFFLKETANLSTGGIAIDRTDEVHPDIKDMCQRASRLIGLDICGVDLIAEDIEKSVNDQQCGIIELNAGPGIRMHHYPSAGKARNVAGAIMDYLFADENSGRISIASITGTNGKTTVTRMLAHMLQQTNTNVGMTTTDGIYINNTKIVSGDTTGPISARTILADPSVDIAVLETARGGIVKRGLGYDWSDVGIFTNLKADHFGQDGMEDLEDVLNAKSLVIERVKRGGHVILNADSKEIVSLANSTRCEIHLKNLTYFSLFDNNPVIEKHLSQRGHAYFLKDGNIIEAQGGYESPVVALADIPLTMGGTSDFHAANVMAALAGAHALGLSDQEIIKGLLSFELSKNTGRTNIFKIGRGYLLLDYGHNPDALMSISNMCRKWNVSSLTAIIASPGDRADELLEQMGLTAALFFDKIIIREDRDLRERRPREAAEVIFNAVMGTNPLADCQIILNSFEALEHTIKKMKENELILYFYEDFKLAQEELNILGAEQMYDSSLFLKPNSNLQLKKGDEWLQYSF